MPRPLRLCLLGGGGFIGSHLVERVLQATDWSVLAVDLAGKKLEHLPPNVRLEFEHKPVTHPDLDRWVREADAVVSLSAICTPADYNTRPVEVIESNFLDPYRVVIACARHRRRLIQFSTSEAYGKPLNHAPLSEEKTPLVLGPVAKERWSYSAAKQLLERAVMAHGHERGLPFTIIRPFNFIGPRMDFLPGVDGEGVPRVFAGFMKALLFDESLPLVDGGRSRRTFTYIDDGIDALMAVLNAPQASAGKIFNVGHPGNDVSIAQLANLMMARFPTLAGRPLGPRCRPVPVSAEEFYGPGYDDSAHRVPDVGLARRLLGWVPKVSLEAALEKSMAAFITQYAGDHAKHV